MADNRWWGLRASGSMQVEAKTYVIKSVISLFATNVIDQPFSLFISIGFVWRALVKLYKIRQKSHSDGFYLNLPPCLIRACFDTLCYGTHCHCATSMVLFFPQQLSYDCILHYVKPRYPAPVSKYWEGGWAQSKGQNGSGRSRGTKQGTEPVGGNTGKHHLPSQLSLIQSIAPLHLHP